MAQCFLIWRYSVAVRSVCSSTVFLTQRYSVATGCSITEYQCLLCCSLTWRQVMFHPPPTHTHTPRTLPLTFPSRNFHLSEQIHINIMQFPKAVPGSVKTRFSRSGNSSISSSPFFFPFPYFRSSFFSFLTFLFSSS